jgi:orotate phosphoribosyltransferase
MTIDVDCCPTTSLDGMRRNVAAAIATSGVIQTGEKRARGGLNLPGMWINLSLLSSVPCALRAVHCGLDRLFTRRFLVGAPQHGYTFAAVMTGGAIFTTYLGDRYGRPYGFVHKDGVVELQKQVLEGCRVILVEDVVTEAGSLMRAGEMIQACGGEVVGALAIVEYGLRSAEENLRRAGIVCHAVTTVAQIASAAHARGILSDEQVLRVSRWIDNPQ